MQWDLLALDLPTLHDWTELRYSRKLPFFSACHHARLWPLTMILYTLPLTWSVCQVGLLLDSKSPSPAPDIACFLLGQLAPSCLGLVLPPLVPLLFLPSLALRHIGISSIMQGGESKGELVS